MKTPRPASKPSAAATNRAAAEAKAGEEPRSFEAPVNLPAPDGPQTTRSASTSPSPGLSSAGEGSKGGEGPVLRTRAPETLPARNGSQTARPESTSPDGVLTARSGAKDGEEPSTVPAPEIRPAPGEHPTTGSEAGDRASGPATVPALLLTAHGTPGPQGSKTRNAAGAMYESSAKVKPWREAVKSVALDALAHDDAWTPLDEPVRLEIVFTLPRPKSHYGTGRNAGVLKASAPTHPTGKPDLDKLLRSTQDALKDAGVLRDDSVVTATTATKTYVFTGSDALSHPGAVIRVWRLNNPSKESES